MRLKALLILSPLVFVLFSCASDNSAPSGVQLVHESRLAAEGHVANPNTVVMLDLEADTDHVGDTGTLGFDEIPLEVSKARVYQLCFDNEAGADHTMEVVDASGNILATSTVSTGCSDVLLATGKYTVRLRHGAAGTPNLGADRVFLAHVRPYPALLDRTNSYGISEDAPVQGIDFSNYDAWALAVCKADPYHQMFTDSPDTDSPYTGAVYFYTEANFMGCRSSFTYWGSLNTVLRPKSYKMGPFSTFVTYQSEPTYGSLDDLQWDSWSSAGVDGKNVPTYDRTLRIDALQVWTPGWTMYKTSEFDPSQLLEREGWFALHLGTAGLPDPPLYLVRGSIGNINALPYGRDNNPRSSTDYPWLTLPPNTGAVVVSYVGKEGTRRTTRIVNDTDRVQDYKAKIDGIWGYVWTWRLKGDIDENIDLIQLQASVGHCRGCNLKGAELSLNLNDFDFSHADLTGAKFMGSSLNRAIFERSILDHADMDMTTLNCAQLTNCDLSTVRLGYDLLDKAGTCDMDLSGSIVSPKTITWFLVSDLLLTRLKLDETVFSGFPSDFFQFYPSNFNGVQMEGAKFVDVSPAGSVLNLSGSTWKDSHIKGIDLSTVNLTGAVFDGAVARDANFSKSTLTQASFKGTVLSLADFSSADLNRAIFDGASARGAKFNYANLAQTSFKGTTLDGVISTAEYSLGANFSGAIIDRSDFSFTPLGKVDFSHATFTSPILTGALLDGAKFQGSWLVNADLTTAQSFRGADFSHAYLMNADLSAADLSPAPDTITTSSLQSAYLQGADLGNTNLYGASLSQAILSFSPGQMTAPRPRWDPLTKSIVVDQHWPVSYEISDHSALTDGSTTCPNGYPGPCDTVEKWKYVPPPDGGGIDPDS